MFLVAATSNGVAKMPRRKRHDQISEYHLQRIERQVSLLETAITDATLSLRLFCPHCQALELRGNLRVALNVLNDRPAVYVRYNGNSTPGPKKGT